LYRQKELTCQLGTGKIGYVKLSQAATGCTRFLNLVFSIKLKYNISLILISRNLSLDVFNESAAFGLSLLPHFIVVMKKI